jgi:protein-disulfide isomerase
MLPALHALVKNDTGLRLVFKDIPVLGPASVLETRAILAAAKQGGYLKMQQALMTNPAQPTEAMLRDTARGLGLDPARLIADMNSPAITHQIDVNLTLAQDLKVTGTPVFIIGDTVIPGAVDVAALQSAIAALRKRG